ncbi:DUF6062 family protein [Eubacteriales bacterium mix99]
MKYHLDTIPVWDAYRANGECPLCILEEQSEKFNISSFLGGSVMEPDVRTEVNKKGFCPRHNGLLYNAQNRLGLALMTHTHVLETNREMKERTDHLDQVLRNPGKASIPFLKKASGKRSAQEAAIHAFSDWMKQHRDQCIICDRIHDALNQYVYTILHLWEQDPEFRKTMSDSKGFCFSHLPLVLDMATEYLSSKQQGDFLKDLLPVQSRNMDRLEQELQWFTRKFDYRNQDKSWGNSRDALPRILQKLTGKFME